MSQPYHVVVCASVVPDPLQTLEPVSTATGPALKNESMLPAILDPWAAHALYEGAHLAKQNPDSKLWLLSAAPKVKLQQVMMTVAQKVPFELIAVDAPCGGFVNATATAAALTSALRSIPTLELNRLLLFGGWESASRAAGVTLQLVGEALGIVDQFLGVDRLSPQEDGSFEVLERIEGARHQVSRCVGAPAVVGWATGNLGEPRNDPQTGMRNMRTLMPALQKANAVAVTNETLTYTNVALPKQQRTTRVERNMTADDIACEIVQWIRE